MRVLYYVFAATLLTIALVFVSPSYAKVSKRVNIQRLKTDIWSDIEHTLGVDGAAEGRVPTSKGIDAASASPSEKPESMSFQSMISDIASQPRQKDVSLPFYFICLLHLANEHVSVLCCLHNLHYFMFVCILNLEQHMYINTCYIS